MPPVTRVFTPRLTSSGVMPLAVLVWSMMMRNAPIASPEPTAISSPRAEGRVIFSPGSSATSTMATRAKTSPTPPVGPSVSPSTRSPHSIGAIAETTAVTGERMLIGPIARHA